MPACHKSNLMLGIFFWEKNIFNMILEEHVSYWQENGHLLLVNFPMNIVYK